MDAPFVGLSALRLRAPALSAAVLSIVLLSFVGLTAVPLGAQETVDVTVPGFVDFTVDDVTISSAGVPSTVTVSFGNAMLTAGAKLRISVMADTADFSPPSGSAIPATKVSWSVSGAVGGTGSGGTLTSSSFTQVFQSVADPLSGSVSLDFSLAAPGSGIRSGNHTLTIRWQFESVP